VDIDRYKEQAARLDLEGIEWDAFRVQPLAPEVLRCLRYMHDVEHHTVCYLRDLLVTTAHRDPAVTSFLTLWGYEEMWHGEAIAEVLAVHGEFAGPARVGALRARLGAKDRLTPVAHVVASAVVGDGFPALHMAWGALNEWTTQAGYARLSARAAHPVLSELLQRIMRQEGRHIAFYAAEAARRLEGNRRAQRVCRFALRRLWRPVGASLMPRDEVSFLVGYLFGDAEGRAVADRIDRRVDQLPGLAGLGLVRTAADRYAGAW